MTTLQALQESWCVRRGMGRGRGGEASAGCRRGRDREGERDGDLPFRGAGLFKHQDAVVALHATVGIERKDRQQSVRFSIEEREKEKEETQRRKTEKQEAESRERKK
jgi:hypothetical protein